MDTYTLSALFSVGLYCGRYFPISQLRVLYFSILLHSYAIYTQLLQSLMQLLVHQFLH
jgi:hypothetical protein